MRGILLLGALASTDPGRAIAQEHERRAPWPAVRWRDEVAEVEVDGRWHELVAIDGTKGADVVAFCRRTWPDLWQKRFEEDLVEALARMGRPVGANVDLDLIDLATREKVRFTGVEMSRDHRDRLRRARAEAERNRATRREPPAPSLSRADALADLEELDRLLRDGYSYYSRAAGPFGRELDAAKQSLPETLDLGDFARRVQGLLALLGDGHTGLRDLEEHLPDGCLPFLAAEAVGGIAAFRPDREALVDPDRPFLVALDGVPLETWLAAAGRLVARGSPDFVRWHSLRQLRFAAFLRQELGLPPGRTVKVELADAKGRRAAREVPLSSSKPLFGEWPRSRSRMLEGGAGYLRIASMDDGPEALAALHAAMAQLAAADALVIDVRGNGGGSRRILRELFPYFMREGDPPRVANVAAYRLPAGDPAGAPEGYLADRWLFPLTSGEWNAAERRTLAGFAKGFRPRWTPPASAFSDWHFFVLRPDLPAGRTRFERPVAILQDGGCFSATDVFLGAFQGWRGATRIGTTSGGGSGRAVTRRLSRSGLQFRASTMASFRADGSLYDGAGVAPDVEVKPEATDFIGRTDAQLDAALARLKAATARR